MSWDQISNTSSESLFVRLDDQRTQVRVLGDPVVYARHWTRGHTGENCTVKCPDFGNVARKSCPVCAMGEKPRIRAIFPVIDRRTNSVKLLDIPQTVAAQIKALKNNPDWGDPLQYDITIQKSKIAKRVDYQVLPASNRTPLAQNEEVMVRSFFEKVNYQNYALPHTPEEVIAILNGHPIQKAAQAPAAGYTQYAAPQPYGQYAAPQAPIVAPMAPPPPAPVAPAAPVYAPPAPVYTAPVAPIAPAAPVYAPPVAPVAPVVPVAPVAPMAPVAPTPVQPVAPVQPIGPGASAIGDDTINQFAPKPPQIPPRV